MSEATIATGAATAPTTEAGAGSTTTDPAAQAGGQQAATTDWQAEAEKWKALARQNENRAKANADGALVAETKAQKELLAKIAAKVGLAEEAPDPAAITAKLEASEREAKSRTRELTVLRAAARLGADGDALLDSRTFMASIDGIDPAKADDLAEAIKAAVTASPGKYAAQSTASVTGTAQNGQQQATQQQASTSASGSQFNGTAGGQRQWTKADIDRATPAEVAKAMSNHLLDAYLAS